MLRPHRRSLAVAALGLSAVIAGWPAAAGATLPGANGVISYHGSTAANFVIRSVTPNGAVWGVTSEGGNPAWSPDGSRIAFVDRTPSGQPALFTMAPDGSDRTQLADLPGTVAFPTWSPDGSRIAVAIFSSVTGYDIWVTDADGTDPVQLTDHPAEDVLPAWSPDGTKIAFQSTRDGDREIYVIDADGENPTNVSDRPATEEESPDWSPDGSKLAFSSFAQGGSSIFVANADGSGAHQIGAGSQPVWSPDGQWIAFTRTPSSEFGMELFSMRPDGSAITRVTYDGGEKFTPDWQPLGAARITGTSVTTPVATIRYGEVVPFTANVTSGGPAPTGSVQFQVNGFNEDDPVPLDAGGSARYEPPFLLDVGDGVSATYGGDARLGWSTGNAALQILPAATTTSLSTAPNPVTRGGTVDALVTVANTSTAIPPFGSVQFSIDGASIGPALPLDDDGQVAVRLIADLPAGDYAVRVDYFDDTAAIADFSPSSASLVHRVVAPSAPAAATPATPTTGAVVGAVRAADLDAFATLVGAALRRRGFAGLRGPGTLFAAAAPGKLSLKIYARPQGSSAGRAAARRTPLATGGHTFSAPGSRRIRLAVTKPGKRLLRRAKRLRVELRTRFVPMQGTPVSHVERTLVTKRGRARASAGRGLARGAHAPPALSMRR